MSIQDKVKALSKSIPKGLRMILKKELSFRQVVQVWYDQITY